MKELTDLEICKRIAEIEGVSCFEFPDCIVRTSDPDGTGTPQEAIGVYSPLTDDALCFQLMIKYETGCSTCGNFADTHKKAWCAKAKGCKNLTIEITPNRAICLAIIEANNEN